ncbi:peptide chain release factor N(5)-glutamine methyltransferase [Hyphomonas johnsonii]|uniref:peptide chain release factor N(5)-glutamine methyltransferase n=1 Tax=Hyphomonas johnsonii TaxID=81031 RepID=UPI000553D4A5|nr:peptide chain release factor N(5)-glutamine methyltransferase [Hyphomonas johnsonii]
MLAEASRRLRDAGIEAPQREARLLMAVASGLTTSDLIIRGHQPVPASLADTFHAIVARRAAREPFQHIARTASFFGLDLVSDRRALVPRADSEVVVEAALALLPEGRDARVVDLGTGSGCLLAALLATRTELTGIGLDASSDAADLARENVERLGLGNRARILTGSWTEWTGWADVDLVISNPPYINAATIASLDPEVRLHDPLDALDGGEDGLAAYREIVMLARAGLRAGVPIVFEIGFDQRSSVSGLMADAGFIGLGSSRDLAGNDRVVWAFQAES